MFNVSQRRKNYPHDLRSRNGVSKPKARAEAQILDTNMSVLPEREDFCYIWDEV